MAVYKSLHTQQSTIIAEIDRFLTETLADPDLQELVTSKYKRRSELYAQVVASSNGVSLDASKLGDVFGLVKDQSIFAGVRSEAIRVLAKEAPEESIPTLINALREDRSVAVRVIAAEALGEVGRYSENLPVLQRAAVWDESLEVRMAAQSAAYKLSTRREVVSPDQKTAVAVAVVKDKEQIKIQGVVTKRNPDTFRVKDTSNVETIVVMTPATVVRTHRHGVFGGGKPYAATYILRGLRLQVEGVGNSDGALVANLVKFDEQDLRTAQALQQTDEMARENQARITAEEENAKKLAGQIAENQALTAQAQASANQAQASANAAQARADAAQKAATRANNRINGLGDYDPVRNWTVYFRPSSAVLSVAEKQKIDAGVGWVRSQQNTNSWFVEIVGFADTTGNTAANRSLSERRANAVIGYLVSKHNMPLTRLLQPFGYGESKPASDNTTAAGRAKNRRVEIHILANKGITGTPN